MMINTTIENLQDIITNNYYKGAEAVISAIKDKQDNNSFMLSTLKPNDVFVDCKGDKYIVTKQAEGVTYVLRKELLSDSMEFGEDNNWISSNIRKFLNSDYLKTLEERFGAENILEHEIDLFSHDGLRDYGKTVDKVAIRTYDDYREQREILGDNAFDSNRWEWLSTPNSTPSGCSSGYVQVVRSYGDVSYGCSGRHLGVRPFFSLKSSIFVSLDKEE